MKKNVENLSKEKRKKINYKKGKRNKIDFSTLIMLIAATFTYFQISHSLQQRQVRRENLRLF